MDEPSPKTRSARQCETLKCYLNPACIWRFVSTLVTVVVLLVGAYAALRFLPQYSKTYNTMEDHFKYGSDRGDLVLGLPYWAWQALPLTCPRPCRRWPAIEFPAIICNGSMTMSPGRTANRRQDAVNSRGRATRHSVSFTKKTRTVRYGTCPWERPNAIASGWCVFQTNPATDSIAKLPPIPRQSCHLFHGKAATLDRGS